MNIKVSVEKMETMGENDILECLPFFGRDPLDYLEGKYIWDILVKVRGSVEEIEDTELRQLGWISRVITPEQFSNLTLSEVDTIAAFGQFRNLSDQQVLAERVLEDWANKEPPDYTCYDLTTLQHILCGFNRSSIESIHADSYKDAASNLATLRGCPLDALQALASLAQASDAFGPATHWTSSQLKLVGCIMNGLPAMVLPAIPPEGFEALTPDIIPCISPETWKVLNTAQLSHLTPSAVAALSLQQKSLLTREQQKSVTAAYEGMQTKKSDSIAVGPIFQIILFAIYLPQFI